MECRDIGPRRAALSALASNACEGGRRSASIVWGMFAVSGVLPTPYVIN